MTISVFTIENNKRNNVFLRNLSFETTASEVKKRVDELVQTITAVSGESSPEVETVLSEKWSRKIKVTLTTKTFFVEVR